MFSHIYHVIAEFYCIYTAKPFNVLYLRFFFVIAYYEYNIWKYYLRGPFWKHFPNNMVVRYEALYSENRYILLTHTL